MVMVALSQTSTARSARRAVVSRRDFSALLQQVERVVYRVPGFVAGLSMQTMALGVCIYMTPSVSNTMQEK
jgi:hypothetical protein